MSCDILHRLSRARPTLFVCSRLRQLHLPSFQPNFRLTYLLSNTLRRSLFNSHFGRGAAFQWTSARAVWWKRAENTSFLLVLLGWRFASCHGHHLVGCKSRQQQGYLFTSGSDEGDEGTASKFDWLKLWDIVSPDILLLLLAAAVRHQKQCSLCPISLSVCLSLSLFSLCLFLCLCVSLCVCVLLFMSLSTYLFLSICVNAVFLPMSFQSAMVVAILNIQMPLVLGDMVNVVARLEPGYQLQWYVRDLRVPGIKLAGSKL